MRFLVLFILPALFISARPFTANPPSKGKNATALVEIFVSEGCAKSPLAEKTIERIQRENPEIAFVHYHIDYWDFSGWKDSFSDEKFSLYQRRYADKLDGEMQTPTAVVNGKVYFLATDEERIRQEIQRAKLSKPTVQLDVNDATATANQLIISYTYSTSAADEYEVRCVLTQNEITRTIEGGDNKGKKVKQLNVARMEQSSNSKSGSFVLNLPSDYTLDQGKAVVFVQNKSTGVVAAQSIVSLIP